MSLKIHDLSKSFGQKTILTGFSYDFSDTGVYILRGKSGIGKTTLLRIIAGLDKEYSGNVSGGGIGNVSFAPGISTVSRTFSTRKRYAC